MTVTWGIKSFLAGRFFESCSSQSGDTEGRMERAALYLERHDIPSSAFPIVVIPLCRSEIDFCLFVFNGGLELKYLLGLAGGLIVLPEDLAIMNIT